MTSGVLRRGGCLAALVLLASGVLLVLTHSLRDGGRRLPPLDEARFTAARQRWEGSGPADYDIEIVVRGAQSATYRATVRAGEVQSLSRNEHPLSQRRTMGTWSVEGMFDTIQTDLDAIARGGAAPSLDLRAEFHPKYGYPMRYQRVERRRWGANPDVSWEVTHFEGYRL